MVSLGLMIVSANYIFYRYKLQKPIITVRERWQFAGHIIIFLGALYNFISIYLLHGKH